jgi:hypothetical protein
MATIELHKRKERRLFPVPNWKLFVYRWEIDQFLRAKGRRLDEESLRRFSLAYFERRGNAEEDLLRRAAGDYGESEIEKKIPIVKKKIPAQNAFDRYAAATSLKPRTIKRWKPVVDNLVEFLGHDDLARLSKTDVLAWKNKLLDDNRPAWGH